ncbi:MAG: hypothetical protein M3R60_04830, partial [Pseudomonadota bacterium]|nr:hypothetical protein [Pseudomonadota bacterium]
VPVEPMLDAPLLDDEPMPDEDEPMRDGESMPLHALNAATQMAERISFFIFNLLCFVIRTGGFHLLADMLATNAIDRRAVENLSSGVPTRRRLDA